MFMSATNRELRGRIVSYLNTARETLAGFADGMRYHVAHGLDAHFEACVSQVHTREHDADTLRREIGIELFAKSLLPDSREDLLLLLERVDLMPNQAEDVLRQLLIQNIRLPAFTHGSLLELADLGVQAFDLVAEGIEDALGRRTHVQEITRRIDAAEHVGDQIEQKLVAQVFRSELATGERILVRDIITTSGQILDFAQDVGIFLTVFAVKRHI